jgi:ABC-type multidrug transport system ATPase subunit
MATVTCCSQEKKPPALCAEEIFHTHDQGTGWILEGVSLEIHSGELVHLMGDNGSGKSTLLELLAGQRQPVRGSIEIYGEALGVGPEEGRQHLLFLPDALVPSPWLGVSEYLELRARWRGLSREEIPDRLEAALKLWGLLPLRKRPVEALSFGQKRRVVLATASLLAPRILLLDEPTNGLDRSHREIASRFLEEIRQTSAVLVTTHVERQDLPGSTRRLLLEDGKIQEVKP